MPETAALVLAVAVTVLLALTVRRLVQRAEAAEERAAEWHVRCILMAERCERLAVRAEDAKTASETAANVALDAMSDAEDAAEFVASDLDPDDDDFNDDGDVYPGGFR